MTKSIKDAVLVGFEQQGCYGAQRLYTINEISDMIEANKEALIEVIVEVIAEENDWTSLCSHLGTVLRETQPNHWTLVPKED